jgi:Protein of unknown function (DUF3040)
MSLPACQQRILHRIEDALQASDPHLVTMYSIFTRLNAGEPVSAESPARRPLPGRAAAVWAAVLVPLMFVILAIGVQLGGTARGATACAPGHAAARGAPLVSRASCTYGSPGTSSPGRRATNTVERRAPCQSSSSGRTQRNC